MQSATRDQLVSSEVRRHAKLASSVHNYLTSPSYSKVAKDTVMLTMIWVLYGILIFAFEF